ncbi:hypothetical protein K0M31_007134 [Melipona bicolor]|uniref:Uncharacterized protein n=1 Tax=Melipona bicolor TaxID=60889 RepID=A0AA40FSE8_9HYME|nr:hypothetical protein K0M31_007134 [Melipona bicolor]
MELYKKCLKRPMEPVATSGQIKKDVVKMEPLCAEDVGPLCNMGDLVAKFKTIKSGIATKCRQKQKGPPPKEKNTADILKFYNLLMMNMVYPTNWKINRIILINPNRVKDVTN